MKIYISVIFLILLLQKKAYKGVGRYTMEFVEKDLNKKGVHFIELSPLGKSKGFYTHLGYKVLVHDQYYKWISKPEGDLTEYKKYVQEQLE